MGVLSVGGPARPRRTRGAGPCASPRGAVIAAAALAATTLAGCYAPSLRDCTVSCESATECASGQVCGADGLCAAPDRAGRCEAPAPDAPPPPDAALADAPPDAPATIALRVRIMGKGSVVVDGRGTCSSRDPQRGDCTYEIEHGAPQRVRAVPIELDELFMSWMSETCAGEGPICTFTPTAATTVHARFGRDRTDDVRDGAPGGVR